LLQLKLWLSFPDVAIAGAAEAVAAVVLQRQNLTVVAAIECVALYRCAGISRHCFGCCGISHARGYAMLHCIAMVTAVENVIEEL
jgi:hypothetical protein